MTTQILVAADPLAVDEGLRGRLDAVLGLEGVVLGAALERVVVDLTRLTLGASGGMANADHLLGALALTVTVIACAEVARAVRFLNLPIGAALWITPFAYGADWVATLASLACGAALIACSIRRGPVHHRFGASEALIF